MNPPPTDPPCPACGNTPTSLIEDGYSTGLTPWWKYYVQKFSPFRLIRRKTEFRWIPMGECDQVIWSHECVAVKMWHSPLVDAVTTCNVSTADFDFASHWCPLPPLP
jgi:hypothetical protein